MANAQKVAFYESLKQAAIEQQIKYGVPASVTLAQAWIEHGNYSKDTNNYFGIHDDDRYWRNHGGKTVELNDHGRMAHFRVYDSIDQGIEDHSRFFFRNNSRYSAAHSISPLDAKYGEKWAMVICRAGYAERSKDDPDRYANTLIREIRDYDLDKIDQEAVALAQQRGQQIGYMRGTNAPLPSQSAPSYDMAGRASAVTAGGNYCYPIAGDNLVMSDGFGKSPTSYRNHEHNGIDLRAKYQAVFATEDNGRVVDTGYQKSGGKFAIVEYDRADGAKYRVSYCHLNDIAVNKGDKVDAGTQLGVSGNTGNSTGPHLHLTVKYQESGETAFKTIDPLNYLAEISVRGNLTGTVLKKGTNEDLLANIKGSVDTRPTPTEVLLAQQSGNMLTPQQQQNAQQGAVLAQAAGSHNEQDLLSMLLAQNKEAMDGDIISSLVKKMLMGAVSMAMILDRAGSDVFQNTSDSVQQPEQETEEQKAATLIHRQRDSISPAHARDLAQLNFDANYPEHQQSQGQRLA